MGHDSNQGLGVEGRSDELNIPPDRFDFIRDKKHPLYDPRVDMPLDHEMLESIRALVAEKGPAQGIRERVTARRNGADRLLVVKGRMRVRCALKLVEEGVKVLVPTKIVRYTDDAEVYEEIIRENELRNDTPPSMRAVQAQKMIDFGRTKDQVARMFRFKTVQGLEYLLALLDLAAPVKRAVDAGEFSYSLAATELHKFPLDEQVEAMNKLIASGVKGEIAKETLRNARKPKKPGRTAQDASEPVARMRTRLAVENALANLKDANSTKTTIAVRAALRWVMGSDRAFNQCPDLGKLLRGEA